MYKERGAMYFQYVFVPAKNPSVFFSAPRHKDSIVFHYILSEIFDAISFMLREALSSGSLTIKGFISLMDFSTALLSTTYPRFFISTLSLFFIRVAIFLPVSEYLEFLILFTMSFG